MAERTAVEKAVLAALEREPAVKLHRWPVQIEYNVVNRALTLEGEVENIIAKRRAYECVSRVDGVDGVMDRLYVHPSEPRGDGAIRASITQAFLNEPTLRDCALHVYHKGIMETLRVPPGGKDVIGVTVASCWGQVLHNHIARIMWDVPRFPFCLNVRTGSNWTARLMSNKLVMRAIAGRIVANIRR